MKKNKPLKFVEGVFETEIIIKDIERSDSNVKVNNSKNKNDVDPINFAEEQINECFNLIIVSQKDYQSYLDETLNDSNKVTYIKNNYYYYYNKWPLMRRKEHTIFSLPSSVEKIQRIKIF